MKIRLLTPLLLLLTWLVLVPASGQALPLSVGPDTGRMEVLPYSELILDSEDKWQWAGLQKMEAMPWQAASPELANAGFSRSTLWARFTILNDTTEDEFLLQFPSPLIDDLQLIVTSRGRIFEEYRAGDNLPFAQRPVANAGFVFPVYIVPGEDVTVYVRIRTQSSLQFRAVLYSQSGYLEHQLLLQGLHGAYFGIMLVMALYNLFLFMSVRHLSYFYYTCTVVACALLIATLEGYGFQYLWPDWPEINQFFVPMILSMLGLFSVLFTVNILDVSHYSRLMSRFSMGIATTFAAIAVTSPFVEYHLATMATMVVGVISCVTMMANGINTLLSGNKVARFYLLAWSALLISFIVLAFNKFGWLNTGFLAEYSVQVGSLAEVLLFSFALADRINQERNDRMKAQSLAIEQERIATLEQQRYLKLRHAKELEDLRAQQQLLTAEAESKAKTDFLANMSHEIRTPMNGVLGVAELLAQTPLNKEQRDYLNIISGSGKVLLNIINDILDFSKLNAGKMELDAIDFNLQEVCEQTISLSRSLLTSPEVDLYLLISENSK
ncbi:MAG: hypothetical protein KDI36_16090, partial [Pseudomonadales bacterium]|nr:hypothetical protein [Pseudomonadales bacterium]